MVKYAVVDDEGNEMFILAEIFESLDGEQVVNEVNTDGVTIDSPIPSSLSSSSTELIIDPLPIIEPLPLDPLPLPDDRE